MWSAPMFAASWSIEAVSGCGESPGAVKPYWLGACSVATGTTYSAVGNQNDNDLGFVAISGSAFDFHLTATSPSSVLNVPDNVCTGIDFDGDTRPQQVYCDFGADEFRPGQP